ncbi:hypothetical protein [Burkholderia sp. BCC0322]|uniref:hypothetical protein n=1 Tax=unclassified Burkholderia TaxID=2613784 RepID=UPI00158CFE11|nr:hypothetical protein [Burkholderia sp. BCC0322]
MSIDQARGVMRIGSLRETVWKHRHPANTMTDDCDVCRRCDKCGVNAPLRVGGRFSLRVLTSNARRRHFRASSRVPADPVSTCIDVACSDMTSRLRDEFEDLDCDKRARVRIHRGNVSVDARLTCENKKSALSVIEISQRDRVRGAIRRVNETPPASRRLKMRPRMTWRT